MFIRCKFINIVKQRMYVFVFNYLEEKSSFWIGTGSSNKKNFTQVKNMYSIQNEYEFLILYL